MPDICDLILDDHATFRRRFAELDERRATRDAAQLGKLWKPLAELLERHAAAEEAIFYPRLLVLGDEAADETDDAIRDHNSIRHAVRASARRDVGTREWWRAVDDARNENSDHMAEEERAPLPDFRRNADQGLRDELGSRWLAFSVAHAGARRLEDTDTDANAYVDTYGRQRYS